MNSQVLCSCWVRGLLQSCFSAPHTALPDLKSYFFAQAADSDYEESDDLFVGPAGTLDHSDHPSGTTQVNGEASKVHGPDITTYGESNLVAEPQKVKTKPTITCDVVCLRAA